MLVSVNFFFDGELSHGEKSHGVKSWSRFYYACETYSAQTVSVPFDSIGTILHVEDVAYIEAFL